MNFFFVNGNGGIRPDDLDFDIYYQDHDTNRMTSIGFVIR